MKDYMAEDWLEILRFNRLDRFDALWNLDAPWFEELNERLGGWSGVSRLELDGQEGEKKFVFMKRQSNHTRPSFRPPWFKIATGEREMGYLLRFREWGIPTVKPVYFGGRRVKGEVRVVLVTEALEGYKSLDAWAKEEGAHALTPTVRKKLIRSLALVVQKLHATGFEHGNLRGRHVLACIDREEHCSDVRLIDLEGVRRHPKRMDRDLVKLYLNTTGVSRTDTFRFCAYYLEGHGSIQEVKALWRRIAHGAEVRRAEKLARWERKQKLT